MVLNYIWIVFFLAGFLVAFVRVMGYYFRDFFEMHFGLVFTLQDLGVFTDIVNSTFDMAKTSVTICLGLIGVMALWLGIMKIGERGGAVQGLTWLVKPFFRRIFPELHANHPAFGSIMMNFTANMLCLDNAATPLGLKAMDDLQKTNPDKEKASNAMIMFIVLNTSGLTLIPVSIMALRAASGAANPTDIFVPLLIATFVATLAGLIAVSVRQRINLFQPVILLYLVGITMVIVLIFWYVANTDKERVQAMSNLAGNFIIFGLITAFILLGFWRRLNLYETFVEGAKEGFDVAIRIIPYLVAMLVAIGVFRASGAMDLLLGGISSLLKLTGLNTDFVPALPVAIMKPLSGGGARGLMVEAMTNYGPDSFVGRLASVFQGSTETTFYTIAVYFGAVNIRKTRYTISCGLIADLFGILAAIYISYLFFY